MARKNSFIDWLKPEQLEKITDWTMQGITDKQLAYNMGIGVSTLYKWQNEHVEILEAIKEGKKVADEQVENALYRSAIGYTVTDIVEETTDKGIFTRKTTKNIPPNITAMIFWLKNRKPEVWKDKPKEKEEPFGWHIPF